MRYNSGRLISYIDLVGELFMGKEPKIWCMNGVVSDAIGKQVIRKVKPVHSVPIVPAEGCDISIVPAQPVEMYGNEVGLLFYIRIRPEFNQKLLDNIQYKEGAIQVLRRILEMPEKYIPIAKLDNVKVTHSMEYGDDGEEIHRYRVSYPVSTIEAQDIERRLLEFYKITI